MRWRKLGRIFDPAEHDIPNGDALFAQSPQTLARGDSLRVYFSTRTSDGDKFTSHVAFADFAADLRTVLGVNERAVVELGGLGDFDEHGIFPMNVVRTGDGVRGYTCGWNRRVSVSVDTAIGLVTSEDEGTTFVRRHGRGPVLGPSLHEPFLVGDGFVLETDSRFHMWYIFGTRWHRYAPDAAPDRTYKIGHATSEDGISWTPGGGRPIVPDVLGPDEAQALPTVIEIDGRHHMFFCYRESVGFRTDAARGYRIGHAYSDDLETWIRDDDDPSLEGTPGEWDSDMQCYPHVFTWQGEVHLLYNGNDFGRRGFGLAVLER